MVLTHTDPKEVTVLEAIRQILEGLGATPYVWFVAIVTIEMTRRSLCALDNRRKYHRRTYEDRAEHITVLGTIYNEPLEFVDKCLARLKESLEDYTGTYSIFIVIDGYDLFPERARAYALIVQKYTEHVYFTNARAKRTNLRNLMRAARKKGVLYRYTGFMDCDTWFSTTTVIRCLMRLFNDGRVGGVVTSQAIWEPKTVPQRVMHWFERGRFHSSMSAASKLGAVGCMPGRFYIALTELVEHRMEELVDNFWWTLSRGWVRCHAGDDRRITSFVLSAGYKTKMAIDAHVLTLIWETWGDFWAGLRRWSTSSLGYTYRDMKYAWYWRPNYWYVIYQYWFDILFVTVGTVLVVFVYTPLQFFYGDRQVALWVSAILLIIGPMVTMLVRQIAYTVEAKGRNLKDLPWFTLIAFIWVLIRLRALFQPYRVTKWGTKQDAEESRIVWFRPASEMT